MLSVVSIVAIVAIIAALTIAWTRRFLAVGALALSNVFVHVLTSFGGGYRDNCTGTPFLRPTIHNELALCAERLYNLEPLAILQLVTSMWVHADLLHLIGNMFILLVFALVFEELIGPRRLIILYLITGVFAAIAQVITNFGEPMLLLGASGAVAGITGGFAGAYPNMVMRLPIPGPIIFFAKMRVITWAVLFALVQIAFQAFSVYSNAVGGVAYAAHLGGLILGLGLGYYWIRKARIGDKGPSIKIELEDLEQFAIDSATKRAYDEMRANRDEPQVFSAWFDRFWQGAKDPVTKQPVHPGSRGRILREDGTEVPLAPRKP